MHEAFRVAGPMTDSTPRWGYPLDVVMEREIPDATVARLPVYRRALIKLTANGQSTVSSAALADLAGVNAAKVRKDLSYIGTSGVRGVGYDVKYLLGQIDDALGLNVESPVVIVGMGNLGRALADYGGFGSRGFPIAALVDSSPDKVGSVIAGIEVRGAHDLQAIVRDEHIRIELLLHLPMQLKGWPTHWSRRELARSCRSLQPCYRCPIRFRYAR